MAKKIVKKKISTNEDNLEIGIYQVETHDFFRYLSGLCQRIRGKGKNWMATVSKEGIINLNQDYEALPKEWFFAIIHCKLHLAFGHFDDDKMPIQLKTEQKSVFLYLWNMACDIYIAQFLEGLKLLGEHCPNPNHYFQRKFEDEAEIFNYLLEQHYESEEQLWGTANRNSKDMIGLEDPWVYTEGEENPHIRQFSKALEKTITEAVCDAGGYSYYQWEYQDAPTKAKQWFVEHYPLLGGVAAGFQLVTDENVCYREAIQVAAVDITEGVIYANKGIRLSLEEWKFVMAHEFLHAGLEHQQRCQGRDPYLWNIACDFLVNGWLQEMGIGRMPNLGILYDESLKGLSAESIYDQIMEKVKSYKDLDTFRGYGKGDLLRGKSGVTFRKSLLENRTLDDFFKEALMQGMEYHLQNQRGDIPAGLQEEIRAIAMPAIKWDVQLANWFDHQFAETKKVRSYAYPSRRQSSTPDIPRASYRVQRHEDQDKTFAVIIDTSGSVDASMLSMVLGSIASYAVSKEVSYVRVVFCDAVAYDAGYIRTEEIAEKVDVKGRGGTRLQPAIDLLEEAINFPKDGPILIITDGMIENKLRIHRQHAFLLPFGSRLPFYPVGDIFYMDKREI